MVMKFLGAVFCLWVASTATFAGTLDDIKSSGELKLGYRADTPPFSYRGPGKDPEGFTVDLCHIIARDIQKILRLEKLNIKWVQVSASDRFDAVISGRVHLVCGTTTITLSRQEQVDFSNLIYATGASLMRWNDVEIDSVDDLNGKRVSVVAGTTTEKVLRETLERKHIIAKVVTVSDHAKALKLLASRKTEAMAADQATLFGIGYKSQGENNLVITQDMLSFEPFALPLRRNDADFRLVVNRSLSDLYRRGDVGRSWQSWFGQYDVQPTRMLLTLYRLNTFEE